MNLKSCIASCDAGFLMGKCPDMFYNISAKPSRLRRWCHNMYEVVKMAIKKNRHRFTGILHKHRRGFGFVSCEDIEQDVFVSARSMQGAMNGDEVEIDLRPQYMWRDSPEATITKVLKRNTSEVVGTFEKINRLGFVIPEGRKQNEDIFIRKKDFSGAKRGDKVVVQIIHYPDRDNGAQGRIVEIISRAGEAGGDIKAVARTYGMRDTFPSRANAEAKAMKRQGVREEDIKSRRDLRGKHIFTIDGADSKDFDDAVSLDILPNGNYLLGVHIADVSHYVREEGPLDKEALKRGTSVYLLNQVIPMLPKALSNDICSLNPYEDRLTVSVDMELSREGVLVNHEIYESVIRSAARFVYDDVSDLLERGEWKLKKDYDIFKDELHAMHELALKLEQRRRERGSIDFDLDESQIVLNEQGIPVSVEVAQRRSANKMIEEFMLLANETVAEHFYWMEVPFLYRVHEKPEAEKLEALQIFLRSFGIALRGNRSTIHPRAISAILEQVKGKPCENVVSSVTLRSMQKAYYSTVCDGHFGLALKYYCHFTSPIRRYPDLMIHRIIKAVLHYGVNGKLAKHFAKAASEAADISSAAERQAIEAEREVEKIKKAEYMSYHVGEVFDGIISGVTGFGLYVQLENTIEGLVHVDSIYDDYYGYNAEHYALMGRRKGKIYKLGDPVSIFVKDVNTGRGEIDFILAGFAPKASGK